MNQRIKKAFVDIFNLDQWMANLIKLLNKVLTKKKKECSSENCTDQSWNVEVSALEVNTGGKMVRM